jgi:hypothetical protein
MKPETKASIGKWLVEFIVFLAILGLNWWLVEGNGWLIWFLSSTEWAGIMLSVKVTDNRNLFDIADRELVRVSALLTLWRRRSRTSNLSWKRWSPTWLRWNVRDGWAGLEPPSREICHDEIAEPGFATVGHRHIVALSARRTAHHGGRLPVSSNREKEAERGSQKEEALDR